MKETLKLIQKNFFLFITAIIVDVTFFIAYGFFTAPITNKIIEHAALITNKLSIIMAEQPTGILKHLFDPEIQPITIKLGLLITLMFIVTYIIYCIFQGTSWWITTLITKKGYKYHKYLQGFAKINLYWMLGYIIYKILDVIISVKFVVLQKITENAINIEGKILFAGLLLLGITALFSYPTLKAGTLYRTPLRKSLPILFISAIAYIAIQFIIQYLGKINIHAALITGAILIFTAANYIKIYTAKNVHAHT